MDFVRQSRFGRAARVFLSLFPACVALILVSFASPCMLRAQTPPETVGRIYGDDIAVKGAIGMEVENGRSTAVLASGSDVTVRAG